MSIQEHLNKIRNAIYGREVRESIAKGIEAAYDDASEKDNANMEVKIARGTHPNLRSRLEEVDNKQQQTTAQLAQKVNKNRGEITSADLSQEVKEQMTGGSVAVVGKNAVLRENIVNGAITPEKTNFITTGKNLFDKNKATPDTFVGENNGIIGSYPGTSTSDYIPVLPNTTYIQNTNHRRAFYNASKEYISGLGTDHTGAFTTPPNTAYVIVTVYNVSINSFQLELGSVITEYEPYKLLFNDLDVGDQIGDSDVDTLHLKNNAVTNDKLAVNSVELRNVKLPIVKILHPRSIVVDYGTNEIKLTRELFIFEDAKITNLYVQANYTPINISGIMSSTDYASYVLYLDMSLSQSENRLKFDRINDVPVDRNIYILTRFYQRRIFDNFYGIQVLDSEGNEIQQFRTVNGTAESPIEFGFFNENKHRMLLAPKMFFVDEDTLPIYRTSFMTGSEDFTDNTLRTALLYENEKHEPTINYFYEDITLKPKELPNRFKIVMKGERSSVDHYFTDIEKVSVSKIEKEGLSPNILTIGDSLTNRSTVTFTRDKLEEYGVSPNMLGTFRDTLSTPSESRGGWKLKNFIGKSNVANGVTVSLGTGGVSSVRDENPFLKLATDVDKANHPNWCFRNTGADTELSLAEDIDKTGDFYIFDFADYLTKYGLETPNVVTITLGTNDVKVESVEEMVEAIEVMVTQIKSAAPNIKIGISPINTFSIADGVWDTKIATWVERCITKVIDLSKTYEGLDIVGAHQHMNREFIYPYNASTVSEVNIEQKANTTDALHFGDLGRRQFAKTLASYVMNVI